MVIKAVDILRGWADASWEPWAESREQLRKMLDEIEAEDAEMKSFCERVERAAKAREELEVFGTAYTPLPLDADGVPIRDGDRVKDVSAYGHEWDVLAVARGYWVSVDGSTHKPGQFVHAKRTLEDVLRDYYFTAKEQCDGNYGDLHGELIPRYAEEIRELLGVGE